MIETRDYSDPTLKEKNVKEVEKTTTFAAIAELLQYLELPNL